MEYLSLFLNIVCPGLGSLIIGEYLRGIGQLFLYFFGLLTTFIGIGFVLILIALFWALVTSVEHFKEKS